MRFLKSFILQLFCFCCCYCFCCRTTFALTFPLPENGNNIVGQVQSARVVQYPNFTSITDFGMYFQVGYLEWQEANPKIKLNALSYQNRLLIPTRYILPAAPYKGIVINLSELRLYYYPPNSDEVVTFPVGIGRTGYNTPIVQTKIISKKINPIWIPPQDARLIALDEGIVLPKMILSGPENPLGDYAMRLGYLSNGLPNYLIHGTNDPAGVGRRVSSGCIRMYPNDIETLFNMVKIGTPVTIVNQRIKAGWQDNTLYLEVHAPVYQQNKDEDNNNDKNKKSIIKQDGQNMKNISRVIVNQTKYHPANIDWNKVIAVVKAQNGLPEPIGQASNFPQAENYN